MTSTVIWLEKKCKTDKPSVQYPFPEQFLGHVDSAITVNIFFDSPVGLWVILSVRFSNFLASFKHMVSKFLILEYKNMSDPVI